MQRKFRMQLVQNNFYELKNEQHLLNANVKFIGFVLLFFKLSLILVLVKIILLIPDFFARIFSNNFELKNNTNFPSFPNFKGL